jgi:hypothetical protein
MSTELCGNRTEQRLSLTFCKWCSRVIHRSKTERKEFDSPFCDRICLDEFNFNRDLKNKFLGKYNLIDQDSIAQELKDNGEITLKYAKENNIPSDKFPHYIQRLIRSGWVIESKRSTSRARIYKLISYTK